MAIRSKTANRILGRIAGSAIRVLVKSLSIDDRQVAKELDPRRTRRPVGCIGVIWHETLLLPTALFGGFGGITLISQSGDGELATAIAQNLGWRVVRGSSTRGGVAAVREILAAAGEKAVDIAFPADGPRGPRRVVKDGVLFLAARSGLPLLPVGIGFDRPWRFGSWDRFAVPKPFRKAAIVFGPTIEVPKDAGRDLIDEYRLKIQAAMDHATERAESLAADKSIPRDLAA